MGLKDYEQPSVTCDLAVFTVREDSLSILLVKRGIEPFKNKWALPGGFVNNEESIDSAAKRELKEETGISDVYLEQLYTFGEVGRDPRGRVITVSYIALVNSDEIKLTPSTDAVEAKWFNVKDLPSLAFDHKKIIDYAIQRLKWKFEYTPVAFSLLSKKFSLTDLQKIYEIVFDKEFDKRNFRKKILSLNILKEEGLQTNVAYRPAMLYSLKNNIKGIIEIL